MVTCGGWAEYDDVFSGTKRHRTEFCHELIVGGNPAAGKATITLSVYPRFNGMDEECLRAPTPYPEA